jgi:hypothetical protein
MSSEAQDRLRSARAKIQRAKEHIVTGPLPSGVEPVRFFPRWLGWDLARLRLLFPGSVNVFR